MSVLIDADPEDIKAQLWGSFLLFIQTFFPLVTGREFTISRPDGRESHFITISRELTKVFRLEERDVIINVPPGYGKSVMCSMWVAWTLSRWPDSNYLYISYSKSLAAKHTEFIRRIIQNKLYGDLFEVRIRDDSRAKDFFQTVQGGSIKAFGASGAITGQDAGLPNQNRFTGAVIIDDAHKPDEVHSDTIRESVITNYRETIVQRPRGPSVPILFIGQRLHEDDLAAFLISGKDERVYKQVILKSIDDAGNALYPEVNPLEMLREKQEKNEYVFASQFQQDPIPAGGALFKRKDFLFLPREPEILCTFITADTAETDKSWNDATVFSFWGLYEIEEMGHKTGIHALHWLDCEEIRVEPKDLEDSFRSFYANCMLYPVKPEMAAIEKKSSGVTLCSILSDMRGLKIREVMRTKASGSKTARFLEMQPKIASKLVTFTEDARHAEMCIKHMIKITANDTHKNDDVCFITNTKIATIHGERNIQDVKAGDKVITPFGIGTVTAAGCTGYKNVITKRGLTGTPSHLIYHNYSFLPLSALTDTITLDCLSFGSLFKWRQTELFSSMVLNTSFRHREDIINLGKQGIKMNSFIGQCGNFIADRKYQQAILFTIKTIINIITVMKILSVYHLSNIAKSILKEKSQTLTAKRYLRKCGKTLIDIFKRPREKREELRSQPSLSMRIKKSIAVFVKENLWPLDLSSIYAVQNAAVSIQTPGVLTECENYHYSNLSAYSATANSPPRLDLQKEITQRPALDHVPEDMDTQYVYSLSVDHGVYYANGTLAKNCDTAYDAIKIALIDKTLYIPGVKQSHDTILQRMNQSFINRQTALSSGNRFNG